MKGAYVTVLCHGDGYVPGVEALGRSLVGNGASYPLVLLVTSDVSQEARAKLAKEGWTLREVEPLSNPNPETNLLFPRFHEVFTKLRAWELTDLDKVVLMDADMIALQNIDELFERPYFAAAPDFFMPDRFNSGLMVLTPKQETFDAMMKALGGAESYDGGDQGFLNSFFPPWWAMPVEHRLPMGYNTHHFIYQFMRNHPSLRRNLSNEIKVVHYTLQKPWLARPTLSGGAEIWWRAYFGAHPEEDKAWKRQLHAMEDWSFERFVSALTG